MVGYLQLGGNGDVGVGNGRGGGGRGGASAVGLLHEHLDLLEMKMSREERKEAGR